MWTNGATDEELVISKKLETIIIYAGMPYGTVALPAFCSLSQPASIIKYIQKRMEWIKSTNILKNKPIN
jgi:hypothetical protein